MYNARNHVFLDNYPSGWTCYVGRKKAGAGSSPGGHSPDRYWRIYDKHAESGGEIDAYRIEVETHRERSVAIAQVIADYARHGIGNDGMALVLASLCIDGLDVRYPGDSRWSRRVRPAKWEHVCQYKEYAESKTHRIPPSLSKRMDWFRKCVIPSILDCERATDKQWLEDELRVMIAELTQSRVHGNVKSIALMRQEYERWMKPCVKR
jgi:DNA relaxase NicK